MYSSLKTFLVAAVMVALFVAFLPTAIDRELHRMKVACEIDKARGYPVECPK